MWVLKERIRFIGVGTMGSRIIRNLLKARYKVTVFDVREEAMQKGLGVGSIREIEVKGVSIRKLCVGSSPHTVNTKSYT